MELDCQLAQAIDNKNFSATQPVLLLVYFIGISPPMVALATQGLTCLVSADSGVHSDVIVVLSRGDILRNHKVEIAVQLWQAQ